MLFLALEKVRIVKSTPPKVFTTRETPPPPLQMGSVGVGVAVSVGNLPPPPTPPPPPTTTYHYLENRVVKLRLKLASIVVSADELFLLTPKLSRSLHDLN